MTPAHEDRDDDTPPGELDRDEAASQPAPEERGPDKQRRILYGAIAAALLSGAAYFGYRYQRTPAGEPCAAAWTCRPLAGHSDPECRTVAGRGQVCAVPCDKERPPGEACPEGLSCDQLLWETDGTAQTGWFCLPRTSTP